MGVLCTEIVIEIILNKTPRSVLELRCYSCGYSQINVIVHDHTLAFSQEIL